MTVGAAYDAVASAYTALVADSLATDAFERFAIESFGALCREAGNATIADLGCGPGRVAAHLAAAGNQVVGVDVSAEMIRIAREGAPSVSFTVGSMSSYLSSQGVGHALFWFSAIHLEPAELAALLGTTFSAVAPGGYVLLGFQATDDPAGATEPYDHRVFPAHLYSLATVRSLLLEAGFAVLQLGLRAPGPTERAALGFVLGQRP